jgi:DNA polymerase I
MPWRALPFDETVLVDFEFVDKPGERPEVVCLVAHELRSGRRFPIWQDQLGKEPPYRTDRKTLFVAYYAAAELTCHLALGWPMPTNILDLFTEFRRLTNNSSDHQQPAASLLDALDHYRIDNIGMAEKEHWRDVVIRGGPWSADERAGILDYCASDVEGLAKLLPAMLADQAIPRLQLARIRGSYMRAEAIMRHRGIPVDMPLFDRMSRRWPDLRQALIDEMSDRYPFFERVKVKSVPHTVFRKKRLKEWLDQNGVEYWPQTPTGQLSTSEETLRAMAKRCPQAVDFCTTKISLDKLKSFKLAVGSDGRNRCMLSAFQSKTGRNQPSNSKYVFGLDAGYRSLLKPPEGMAIAYLDYSSQEFALAAYFSRDANMIAAYESGDPYITLAKMAGAVPADATKKTHKSVRDQYKLAALGLQYGMGSKTLSEYVGVSLVRAKALRRDHREAFPQFWKWSAGVQNAGIASRELRTVFDWRMKVLPSVSPGSLMNFPMQANGAEMLRLFCCYAVDRGIPIIAPVHDAVMVEGPNADIDDIVVETKAAMMEASRQVLGGPTVRVDHKIVKFPDRYVDGRDGSTELWDLTLRLLEKIER